MVYGAVSARRVIAKVYRDLPIEDPSFEIDAVEWIGEVLEAVGAGTQLVSEEKWQVVTNHQTPLPWNVVHFKGLYAVDEAPLKNNYQNKEMPYDLSSIGDKTRYLIPRSDNQINKGVGDDNTHIVHASNDDRFDYARVDNTYDRVKNDEYYNLQGDYVITSFPEALVLLDYEGIPVDEQGWPLIPDDVSYFQACFWYILSRLILRGWSHPSSDITYRFAEKRYLKYVTQARAKAQYPDLDTMENIKQLWLQMVNHRQFNTSNLDTSIGDNKDTTDPLASLDNDYRVTEDGVVRTTESDDYRTIE